MASYINLNQKQNKLKKQQVTIKNASRNPYYKAKKS